MRAMTIRFRDVIVSVDSNGLLWATKFRHPYVNRAMEVCSRLGDWDSWTILLAAMLAMRGRSRHAAIKALPSILTTLGFCYGLKRLARRARPSVKVEGFSTLLTDPDPYSFPSSHSAVSWAACVSMARAFGGVAWFLTIPAVLISYSRIHVGAHYPLDVVIGASIGTSVALAK